MKLKIKEFFLTTIILISLLFFISQTILAQEDDDPYGLHKTAEKAYGQASLQGEEDVLPTVIGNIIGLVLSFLGIIFFILIIYGGFMWMTARGNEEQVGKARKIVINAAVGLAVVLAAYAITAFISTQLQTATSPSS